MEKWALILGASSGIGLASARKLAAEQFNLCLLHRTRRGEQSQFEEHLSSMRQGGSQILEFNADALRDQVRNEVLSELKVRQIRINLLLHSVARGNLKLMAAIRNEDMLPVGLQRAFHQQTEYLREDDFLLTTQAMAVSYFSWAKALLDKKLFSENAQCLALTSEGSHKAWRNYAAVAAAKAALEAISRNMALEFAQHGIRSNILQPGVTDTPSLRMIPGSDYLKKQSIQRNPFGRLTTPADVANVVYLLTQAEAAWINGALIPVDGGESIT